MMKYLTLVAVLLPTWLFAQIDSTRTIQTKLYPKWTLWVPGASHFYDNKPLRGILFASAELGGLASGLALDSKFRKTGGSSAYANFPFLLGMQAFNIDKCHWVMNQNQAIKEYCPSYRFDPVSFNDLLKAPFKRENIFTPITGGFVLVAVAELLLFSNHDRHIGQVDKMYFVDHYIDRDPALAIYGATSIAASFGAGVAEEYIFRNYLMPIMSVKHGERKGLFYSSAVFGGVHFANVLFAENPDYTGALVQVAMASLGGYFLGRDVQKRGYRIGPAVAAHMWYDAVLMVGSFLLDPESNYLGVNIHFNIE